MSLITPDIGLLFWMLLSFSIVLIILKKFAWKPILEGLKERETSIQEAIDTAKKVREEMAALQSDNEQMLREARIERDNLIKEARATKDAIVGQAKDKAKAEADKIMAQATANIENEKMAAITELRNQVGILSIEIAEKILKAELSSEDKQKALVTGLLADVSLN